MKSLRGKSLLVLLWMVLLATFCSAEKSYLVVQVSDIHDKPVVAVKLAVKGSSESGTSDSAGRARIKLDPQAKVNDWIALLILQSPKGKDLVFISPWDAHAQVPPFDNESVNFLPLVLAERGDRALLESGKALTTIVAQINKANSPKSKEPEPEQQRQEALATTAKSFGLAPEEVDKAIRAWGQRTEDPYQKGLAALYEKNYPLASKQLSQSLEMREKELAKAQAATADAAFFLGESKYAEGKFSESFAAYRKASSLLPVDPMILNGLGLSQQALGRYTESESSFQQALNIAEKTVEQEPALTAMLLNNLATVLQDKGNYPNAAALSRRALALIENTFPSNSLAIASSLSNLALSLKNMGDYAEAEKLYARSLDILERQPDASLFLAATLHNYASLYIEKSDFKTSESLYRRSLEIAEKTLPHNHPFLSHFLDGLAALLAQKGDYTAAESMSRRALQITESSLGPQHPNVALYARGLCGVLIEKGDYASAEPLCRRALEIHAQTLGTDHPEFSQDLKVLYSLLFRQKKIGVESEKLAERALQIDKKAYGTRHPEVATDLTRLASSLETKRDHTQLLLAEILCREALKIVEETLGENHPDMVEVLEEYAQLQLLKGDFLQAELLYRRAVRIVEKAFGEEHPNIGLPVK